MKEAQERIAALAVLAEAGLYAELIAQPQDVEAATAAILVHALELATPDLSAEHRARLFKGEDE